MLQGELQSVAFFTRMAKGSETLSMASEVDHFQRILDLEQELRELEDEREKEVSSLYGGPSVNHFSSFVQELEDTESDEEGGVKYFARKQATRQPTSSDEKASRSHAEQPKNVKFEMETFAWDRQHSSVSSYERYLEMRRKAEASALIRSRREAAVVEEEERRKPVQRWSRRREVTSTAGLQGTDEVIRGRNRESEDADCDDASRLSNGAEGSLSSRSREEDEEEERIRGVVGANDLVNDVGRYGKRRPARSEEGEAPKVETAAMRANGRDWNVKMSLQGLKGRADTVKRNACSLVELIPMEQSRRAPAGRGSSAACLLEDDDMDAPAIWNMRKEAKVPRPTDWQGERGQDKDKERLSHGVRVKIFGLKKNLDFNGCTGVVKAFDEESSCYQVLVEKDHSLGWIGRDHLKLEGEEEEKQLPSSS
ncbi:hypothetical protein GUITHDRAFT_140447 [Guillardia theta CCMP2712]|uniref:Uncharacterized protein n=1 Tax=Guillardia theta (strain CCMP2712) TaxID=905079 RepID=L1J4D7_GUITC|nr:hypothetical protein GUITHDRAFT_140447 [Guillardia theta CCMP2712]EKX43388.1 hypothetical protein GUITHDRAFT_140447 [Guillardia theta CCMP2712]|eukprot:XP_005830368.1 hypothetical protein GUITHDRAFT_140447 [Guillardia theta CCMP2712]